MQARMTNPAFLVPDAMNALLTVGKATTKAGVPATTLDLVHLRASPINGCSYCVDLHARTLKKAGANDERLFAVAAWRESPYFTDAERAALALAEAATRLSDRSDPVPDAVWAEAEKHYEPQALAALVMSIAMVNLWNRLNVTTRQVAGAHKDGW